MSDHDKEVWYRYTGVLACALNMQVYESSGATTYYNLHCEEYRVLRETPKGVWLDMGFGEFGKQFVLRSARKRFAYPTKAAALNSFIARKQSQLKILKAQRERAAATLAIALRMREEMGNKQEESRHEARTD